MARGSTPSCSLSLSAAPARDALLTAGIDFDLTQERFAALDEIEPSA